LGKIRIMRPLWAERERKRDGMEARGKGVAHLHVEQPGVFEVLVRIPEHHR
jgi:hypothetical protein